MIRELLTEEQRRRLEVWFLAQRATPSQPPKDADDVSETESCSSKTTSVTSENEGPALALADVGEGEIPDWMETPLPEGAEGAVSQQLEPPVPCLQQRGGTSKASARRGRGRNSGGTHGVCKSCEHWYSTIFLHHLAIRGRSYTDLADAISDHIILVTVKHRILELLDGTRTFDQCVLQAFSELPRDGSEQKTWRFRIVINTMFFVGVCLETPSMDMEAAMTKWKEVMHFAPWQNIATARRGRTPFLSRTNLTPQAANERWDMLRSWYLDVGVAAGWQRELLEVRLLKLEEKNKARKSEAILRWRRHEEGVQRRTERRRLYAKPWDFAPLAVEEPDVCRCVLRLASCMRSEVQARARSVRHRARVRRAALTQRRRHFSRRLRDEKNFTMQEILGSGRRRSNV